MVTVSKEEDIRKLEMAAEIIMAPPNQVSAEHRKEAENYFLEIEREYTTICHMPRNIGIHPNHFVMFEISQILAHSLLKQWNAYQEEDVRNICTYLLNFPIHRQGLPNFVISEIVRTAAILLKRACVSLESLDALFLAKIEELIRSENEQWQALGLQIIETITSEFQTAWRSSNISITWDFHIQAKKHFENALLKSFLQLSLSTLSQLLSHDLSSPIHLKICDNFLRVAIIVLSWNFSPKLVTIRLRVLISVLKTSSFRPPKEWRDFFQDTSIINFFVELHKRVRRNEDLSLNSLNCLSQLASVMGDVLAPAIDDSPILGASLATGDHKIHDIYVQTFASHLVDLFAHEMHEHEMLPLSQLFTYHPIIVFKRFPAPLISRFVEFVSQTILKLTGPAMGFNSQQESEAYHEALHNFYQVWRNILRSSNLFLPEVAALIICENEKIIEEFLKTVLSAPYGNRQMISDKEIIEENEEEEDDREVFSDLLCDMGFFILKSLHKFMDFAIRILNGYIRQFRQISSSVTIEEVRRWQEDMHWLFLLIGHQLQQSSFDCISNLPDEFATMCLDGYKSGEYVRINNEQFFSQCLTQPLDETVLDQKIDPVTLLSGHIISWVVLEYNALQHYGPDAALISPELCRTTLWLFGLIMISLTPRESLDDSEVDGQSEMAKLLPCIPTTGLLSSQIVELSLSKIFATLTKMSGEEKLCKDAIHLIINFAEYRAETLAESDHLYNLLSHINLENLPSRRSLIKSLVIIGSVVNSDVIRQKMYSTILEPLALADLLECFTGIADASQSDAALILFRFLQPIFNQCPNLMIQRPESQLLVNSILEFFKTVTDVLFFYVESSEECEIFHRELLRLVEAYRQTQLVKYHSVSFAADEEDNKTLDLCTLIEILCHSVSKTFMPTFDGAEAW
uniref:Exportin-4 n=1 Tax=Ditylenchus dipsaci TaxID=166011 RepID=A0A915E073_9BILA